MHRSKKKESRRYISLREGCSCTELKVTPANWDKAGASVARDWQIWYRFYDPVFKDHPQFGKGKLVAIKGMNDQHTLGERRDITIDLMNKEREQLDKGWNPIRRKFMASGVKEEAEDYIIGPGTPLCEALQQSYERITATCRKCGGAKIIDDARCPTCKGHGIMCTPEHRTTLKSILKYFKLAAAAAGQHERPVGSVKRRHMVMCWEQLPHVKGKAWSDNLHNAYRAYIIALFKELYKVETIEVIPMGSIEVKAVQRAQRDVLTLAQRELIDKDLKGKNYRLWRLMQIFFHSGARMVELMAVRYEDVDLAGGVIRYEVRKGRAKARRIISRPVKDLALPLWQEVMREARPGQCLFSEGLKPGERTIRREQLTRRWRLWVKGPYGVTADFYSLKHSNATEVREALGAQETMKLTGHTSERMLDEVYDVRKAQRDNDAVRSVGNAFA